MYGAVDRDRTDDLGINSPTLYRLSYDGLHLRITEAYLIVGPVTLLGFQANA